ncbi:hypothetical protein ETAE_2138 [Edwardsiella piscicida]|uniref:Uncharacterized protein n=1 Tax=Edwardsiella piscicida TaxID=1263550 RepID=A0AAU8PMI8_EDWPI|nr:hypothetical protein ETAE_2138 [Edwardsiella tarda EIB202]
MTIASKYSFFIQLNQTKYPHLVNKVTYLALPAPAISAPRGVDAWRG